MYTYRFNIRVFVIFTRDYLTKGVFIIDQIIIITIVIIMQRGL